MFDRRIPRKVPADHVHVDAIGGYATAANDRNVGGSIDVALSPQIVAHLDGSWRKTGDMRSGGYVYAPRSEEHTSELQSLMRISYAVFCLKKKNNNQRHMSMAIMYHTVRSTP